jgi:hypothetical protein
MRFPNELQDKDVLVRVVPKELRKTATKRTSANISSKELVDRSFVSEVRGSLCVPSLLQKKAHASRAKHFQIGISS